MYCDVVREPRQAATAVLAAADSADWSSDDDDGCIPHAWQQVGCDEVGCDEVARAAPSFNMVLSFKRGDRSSCLES